MSSIVVIPPKEIDPIIKALLIKEGFTFLPEKEALKERPLELCRKYLAKYNVTFDEEKIRSQSRKSELVFIRAMIALILHYKGLTSVRIGEVINRDHATVLHLLKYDPRGPGRHYTSEGIITDLNQELRK